MPKLVVLEKGERTEYVLSDVPLTLGRLDSNHIQLTDPSISKRHARIVPVNSGSSWQIEDLGSSNGTYVNGRKVEQHVLQPGNRIKCGTIEFTVEGDGDESPTEAPESNTGASGVRVLASMSIQDSLDLSLVDPDAWELSDSEDTPRLSVDDHPAETKLRLIQSIGEKTIRTFEPERLASEILKISMDFIEAGRGSICLFDNPHGVENDLSFHPLAAIGLRKGEEPQVSRTVLRQLIEENSGVLVRPDSLEHKAMDSLRKMAVTSTLCVPLWTTDRIMGFLSMDRGGANPPFTTSHLDLMIAVAHQAAIGIERGRLASQASREIEARSYLSRYLDTKLVQQILHDREDGKDPLAPAEREVTVMFCDIVSFTKIAERLEPTELSDFIRDYLTSVTEIITRHGGTIDKYIGDAVMSLFGAPVANESAPRDAIAAALEMLEFVRGMDLPPAIKGPLRVCFGISTGKAVIGNIGSAQRVEYTALGDTVNVASRLESFSRPGEICIDDATQERVGEGSFAIQHIGTIDVRNRAQPVEVFKVLG